MLRLRTFGGLWIENANAEPSAGPRPRSLALLAICAASGPKGISRERALGVLWPESRPERARHALSQTLYNLRREAGDDVIVSTPELRLDPRYISSDVEDFRAAVRAKNWTEAIALYAGPFLDGFYLSDAPEFERWSDEERSSLAAEALRALEAAAKAFAGSGRHDEAIGALRRLTRLDPGNSRFAAKYMEALAARGDRAGAVSHGRAHLEILQREFDLDPDAELEQLIERVRESPPPLTITAATQIPARLEPAPPREPPLSPPAPSAPRRVERRRVVGASAAIVVLTAVLADLRGPATLAGHAPRPVLAVGRIQELGLPDSTALGGGRVSGEMLATSLARVADLQVVASSRMLELTPPNADTMRDVLTAAARRAGATEIVEGEFVALPNHEVQLDVRRVDVARGLVRGGYRVSGTDRVALLDSVTALIAVDLGARPPLGSLTRVSTKSAVAFRLYEEGLRSFFQFDAGASKRLFRAALQEDSSFALAAYYAWRTAVATADSSEATLARKAMALAPTAPSRDRLLIMTHVGLGWSDVRALSSAETLATRYPNDPEALIRAGEVLPDLSRAVALINRSIALDSAPGVREGAICRLCDALSLLATRYEWADSDAALRRTIDRWRVLRPNDAAPWAILSDWVVGFGRRAEADAATRRFIALGGTVATNRIEELVRDLRVDDMARADAVCSEGLTSEERWLAEQYRWFCSIGLRMEGRYREATALVRESRLPRSSVVRHDLVPDPYANAILDLETGRAMVAANEFLDIGRARDDTATAGGRRNPRAAPWFLTLAATAAVAGGDTALARRLVDSIEVTGSQSIFGRDPLLHHFVRGLLYSRSGLQEAALREFRAAMHSPTFGYTRINYELAKTLLALRRPREAIPVVQAALHGGIEGSGSYITRTELHELLAQLFDAAGQRDSAMFHYAVVARTWASADPFLAARRDAAARRAGPTNQSIAPAAQPTGHSSRHSR